MTLCSNNWDTDGYQHGVVFKQLGHNRLPVDYLGFFAPKSLTVLSGLDP